MANELCSKELDVVLNKLKITFAEPRLHIVNHFLELINRIDMACEVFLNQSDRTMDSFDAEEMEKARNDQCAMIEVIKAHENECLKNFPNNKFDNTFSGEINAKINEIEETWDHTRLWEVYQEIEDCFLLVERRIFGDKEFLFLKCEDIGCEPTMEYEDYFERTFERHDQEKEYLYPFGVLIAWQGAFFPIAPSFWYVNLESY